MRVRRQQMGATFGQTLKLKRGEVAMFSWIVFKPRAHRDRVKSEVLKDPRITRMMDPKKPVFDPKRTVFGGFKVIVDA